MLFNSVYQTKALLFPKCLDSPSFCFFKLKSHYYHHLRLLYFTKYLYLLSHHCFLTKAFWLMILWHQKKLLLLLSVSSRSFPFQFVHLKHLRNDLKDSKLWLNNHLIHLLTYPFPSENLHLETTHNSTLATPFLILVS